ncbi:MAG TPA: hypothetical protein DDY83_06015 [Bifidobacterium dentium]|nr:hypothetical protein [Bifidobacterium dentium]
MGLRTLFASLCIHSLHAILEAGVAVAPSRRHILEIKVREMGLEPMSMFGAFMKTQLLSQFYIEYD